VIKLKELLSEVDKWEIGPEEETVSDIFDEKAPRDLKRKVDNLFNSNKSEKAWDIILKWGEKNVTRKDIKNYY